MSFSDYAIETKDMGPIIKELSKYSWDTHLKVHIWQMGGPVDYIDGNELYAKSVIVNGAIIEMLADEIGTTLYRLKNIESKTDYYLGLYTLVQGKGPILDANTFQYRAAPRILRYSTFLK